MGRTKFITILAAVMLTAMSWSLPAGAASGEDAGAFVRDLGQQAVALLASKTLTNAQREAGLRQIFLSKFDVDGIGRFALGRYWRIATQAEREQYLKLFKEYVVKVYTKALSQSENTKFVVKSTRPAGIADDILVVSEIGDPDQDPIEVNWRVHTKDGANRVVDVIVDGISMVITKRHDFNAVLAQNDGKIDALLGRLQEEIDKVE